MLDALSYVRGPIATLSAILYTLYQSVLVITVAALTRSVRAIDTICVTLWAWPLLWIAGARLEIRGAENVRTDGKGFLILFNHSSLMDIPAVFCFPRSFRFGAKIELFRIPFFGKAMSMVGVLPIDRGNRNKVMKIYENAIARVEKGECFALAPEGTRQPEPKIGPFKRGPFEFAINAQMDIVPVVLAGTYELLPKGAVFIGVGKWRRKVIMEILPRISTSGIDSTQLDALVENVRAQYVATFERNHREVTAAH
jgi:1-acyl-sn-glycerol-3-phosphate acyltransferase